MKTPHFTKCLGSLLTFALLTFSCSQDTETTFAELVVEETIASETITPDDEVTEEAAEPIIDYQKGTLILNEDTKVALDITKGAEENSTSKKTYSLKSITQPKNGKTEMNNNNEIVYSPTADYHGDDSFSYTLNIQDSTETTVEQVNTFNITITPSKDVVNDVVMTPYETTKTITPLANDTFAETSNVAITEISLADKGIAILNSDNTIKYTPNKNTTGEDVILYKTKLTNSDASETIENGTIKISISAKSITNTHGDIYYVNSTGNDSNKGDSEANAWKTLSYAAGQSSPVKAGDVVYIKAGTYTENVKFYKQGTELKPIKFEGYQSTPGDISTSSFKYGDNLDKSKMPLFNGNDSSKNVCFTTYGSKYLTVKNFQITNYLTGILASDSEFLTFENIIAVNFGIRQQSSYTGKGVKIGSAANNIELKNSFVLNAGAEGVFVNGNYNKIVNTKVYCDDNTNPTDYYVVIFGNYNTVENSEVNRKGDLTHVGHGIQIKGSSQYNEIKNSTAYNTSIGVRWRGAKYNKIIGCKVIGGSDKNGSLIVRDGASNNEFSNCSVSNTKFGIMFYDTTEDSGAQYTGANNIFSNCTFENNRHSISFHKYDVKSPSYGSTFQNCTFQNAEYLFQADRENYSNKMITCKVIDINEETDSSDIVYKLNFTYSGTEFTNTGF
ncbi:right-handed parallel beta-helix repeat-containing protein [Cellulophaga sp. HaHa_2_95]|uniref:Ig-like domain-containing protein n=1 Tax=Cellulophaga sp. HaHa_2_95 TaxID=2745558 RepID=UPI001C4EDF10|nr:Ig-like domain-containing protein [Cellulophaga sp. HaHa_2_95]QXP55242.1 right-handed parallel beta-helix repeat-containing protein [Cellulophaga sp. HaHa_2_95]